MAKAAKKDEITTTTPSNGGGALSLIQNDELADVLGDLDLGTDGLEETDASDRRIAALVFNFNGVDASGDPIPKNRFFDTVSEEVKPRVRLALLTVHKSNAYQVFVDGQGTQTKCRSWDRVTGETDTGVSRACKGCPDKEWRQNPETGKRTRNCADIQNVVGLDLDDGQPKVLRFKKTSERPWKDYLNKHFLGKRIVQGRRANLPLFAVQTEVSLEMVTGKSGSYAKPVLERGEPFTRDEILYFAEQCRSAREWMDDVRAVADNADSHEDADPSADVVIDAADFSDDDGAQPSASTGGRF